MGKRVIMKKISATILLCIAFVICTAGLCFAETTTSAGENTTSAAAVNTENSATDAANIQSGTNTTAATTSTTAAITTATAASTAKKEEVIVEAEIKSDGSITALKGDLSKCEFKLMDTIITLGVDGTEPTIDTLVIPYEIKGKLKSGKNGTVTVLANIPEDGYKKEYYQVVVNERTKQKAYVYTGEITQPGDYLLKITGQGEFKGKVEALFCVVGRPQNLKVTTTDLKLCYGAEGYEMTASTDGDGYGFDWKSSNKKVVTTNSVGLITPTGFGTATVSVSTLGDIVYQPATVKINCTVMPAKVQWANEDRIKIEPVDKKNNVTLKWEEVSGVKEYTIQYSTDKDFGAKKTTAKSSSAGSKSASGTSKTTATAKVYSKTVTENTVTLKLSPSKTYYFRVKAVGSYESGGKKKTSSGAWSDVIIGAEASNVLARI